MSDDAGMTQKGIGRTAPVFDGIEGHATTQRKSTHSSRPKETADESDPDIVAPMRRGSFWTLTVEQNLRLSCHASQWDQADVPGLIRALPH